MIVVIRRDDSVFFWSGQVAADRVRPEQLPAKIQESIDHGSEHEIYIWADARAKYSWVEEVLDNVHAAGIEKVGFLATQKKPTL